MIRRCSIVLLVLGGAYPVVVVADNPSSKALLRKYVEASGNRSTPPALTSELKTGDIGVLPARFKWKVNVYETGMGLRDTVLSSVILHVVQIQNKTNMLVSISRPRSGKGGSGSDEIYLWVEGVPTDSLTDNDHLDSLNPRVFGKLFYVGTKTYTTGTGQRTVKKLTVADIQDEIDAYRKELEAAKHRAKKKYDRALSKLKKKYKKELRASEQEVKEKHLGKD